MNEYIIDIDNCVNDCTTSCIITINTEIQQTILALQKLLPLLVVFGMLLILKIFAIFIDYNF